MLAPLALNRFPPYSCENDIAVSPYLLSPLQRMNNMWCYTVAVTTPARVSPCNVMDFYKLELEVTPQCKDGIRRIFVNGEERVQPTAQEFGPGRWLIKMPGVSACLLESHSHALYMAGRWISMPVDIA